MTIKPAHHTVNPANEDHWELSRCSLGGKKFHHYVKSVSRTSKALGKFEMAKNFADYSQMQISRKLNF